MSTYHIEARYLGSPTPWFNEPRNDRRSAYRAADDCAQEMTECGFAGAATVYRMSAQGRKAVRVVRSAVTRTEE